MKSWNRNFLEPSGPLQACKGTALPLLFLLYCTQLGDSRSGARNRDSSIDHSNNNSYYMFTDSLKCDQLDLQLVNQKTRGEI